MSFPRLTLVVSCLAACAGLLGCTREAVTVPDAAADTNEYDSTSFEYPDSGVLMRDGGGWDGGPSSGLQCESCTRNEDCQGDAFCVDLGGGGRRVCLSTCDRDIPDCPRSFGCLDNLASGSPDPLCTPVGTRCCVDADGDDYGVGVGCNGPDCNDADRVAYFGARELCNEQDDDCDGMVDEGNPEGGLTCFTGMTGACSAGATQCEAGALVCRPAASSIAEVCNGVDDDCDANVDEDDMGRALTRPCYEGPAGTDGVGACTSGVQTCAGGEYRTCIGQITPVMEDCDGVDDDCDGVTDNGNPGGGFGCIAPAPGVCSTGTTQCHGGTLSCDSTIAPGTNPEICDDVDNDCDGMVNEGFPGLGTACTVGLGACRRGGVTVCNAADRTAAPTCDVAAGTPSTEVCNFVDDDCDGRTDEGFTDASGRFTLVTACGACGNDCNLGWPGGAASYHVVPTCTSTGSASSCGFTCMAGYGDADRIRENGCELSPEADTIYVSTPANGGTSAATCGAWDAPCATIQLGLSRALATARARVRVSEGVYFENVVLQNGISLLGGHSAVNWVRNPDIYASIVRGEDAPSTAGGPNDRVAVTAIGISAATELSGFSIEAAAAASGGNSVGIYVRDCSDALLIQDDVVTAGTGGSGSYGTAGASGAAGASGGGGSVSERRACGSGVISSGGGGTRTCGSSVVSGGAGGLSSSPTPGIRSGNGASGSGTLSGAGGLGGYSMEGRVISGASTCLIYATPTDAAPGGIGRAGTDASGGMGGAGAGSIVANQWRGVGGGTGTAGTPGSGGGGGGSPGGVWADGGAFCLFPPTGGGGGSGGCAGAGGGGGAAGGGSFAVFVVYTSTPSTFVRITGNQLRRGVGGRGGDGGTGGGGGEGGNGGAGGLNALASMTYGACLAAGAVGGAGGRGGHAGGGGGGAGGASFEIWISRPGTATPTLTGNTFALPAGTATGGVGGSGGNSSNTATGLGASGTAGLYGNARVGT